MYSGEKKHNSLCSHHHEDDGPQFWCEPQVSPSSSSYNPLHETLCNNYNWCLFLRTKSTTHSVSLLEDRTGSFESSVGHCPARVLSCCQKACLVKYRTVSVMMDIAGTVDLRVAGIAESYCPSSHVASVDCMARATSWTLMAIVGAVSVEHRVPVDHHSTTVVVVVGYVMDVFRIVVSETLAFRVVDDPVERVHHPWMTEMGSSCAVMVVVVEEPFVGVIVEVLVVASVVVATAVVDALVAVVLVVVVHSWSYSLHP